MATHEHELSVREFAHVDDEMLDQLDDFLALVGFAARYRTVCVGVSSTNAFGDHFRFFRNDVSLPPMEEWDFNEAVIDLSDFKEFLRVAYDKYVAYGPDNLLRHALHVVAPRMERTGEGEFTSLYAALETIVGWYSKRRELDLIVPKDDEWRTLQKDVRSFLKNHPVLKGDDGAQKERRGMMLRKVGELRRVPFAHALGNFCEEYDIKLDDLWPVVDRQGNVSLTDIRNRLVHGGTLTASQFHALVGAKQHMRWVVERALLAVFGWPLEKSKIRPDFLARNRTAMIEYAQDREDIKEQGQHVDARATER